MAEITASMVKQLRETTGAGMMDAKNALTENNGDIEAAVDWLRKKGLAKAEKKSSRTAAEGLVAIASSGKTGAVVEVNSETDFVARNEEFQTFVKAVADKALTEASDLDSLLNAKLDGKPVSENLTDKIAKIGENMTIRRMEKHSVSDGVVVGYVHNSVAPNLGKIGVLVALESTGDKEKLEALGKQIAMHAAAAFPKFLKKEDVDTATLDRERDVLREQAKAEGKPAEIVEKMLEGRLRKFYEEICLLEQIFVMDGETKIAKLLENAAKDVGAPVALKSYSRIQLGEGIEKEEVDFAAEVAATARSA
ncbi:MAG: elongation factor Ts [Micavibrio aeruginosavorus]|uniref:Elongation factor Ts n=1 Tax=Micavibrio aeruginosavorus TaxID=349221 RepID=A0A2W5N2B2_9BACT|nr:MAG: elongation factor Ts [Micavibrio aeruginosavorus]